jgi:hypothetical protein
VGEHVGLAETLVITEQTAQAHVKRIFGIREHLRRALGDELRNSDCALNDSLEVDGDAIVPKCFASGEAMHGQ